MWSTLVWDAACELDVEPAIVVIRELLRHFFVIAYRSNQLPAIFFLGLVIHDHDSTNRCWLLLGRLLISKPLRQHRHLHRILNAKCTYLIVFQYFETALWRKSEVKIIGILSFRWLLLYFDLVKCSEVCDFVGRVQGISQLSELLVNQNKRLTKIHLHAVRLLIPFVSEYDIKKNRRLKMTIQNLKRKLARFLIFAQMVSE